MNITRFYSKGSALHEMLLDRLRFGGFPEATDIPMAVDLEVTKYGQVHSNVFFSSILFLAYALNTRPFDLAVNTRAVQVLTEKGKAAGVKAVTSDNKSCIIKAKMVILSASTFETPRILLNSNIPGEAIGRYLVNHPVVVAHASVKRDQFPEVLGIATLLVPSSVDRNYQLLAFTDFWSHYEEKPLRKEVNFELHGYGVVEPRVDNYISLDPRRRDEYGVPMLNVQFSYSHKDQDLIRKIYDSLLAFSSTMMLSLDALPQLFAPGRDNHESGTYRMGDDPSTSATNRYGQVHGITGLYVADNSVLNLTSPANPTLTTVALAIRTADHIIEQMT
ncbi:GMC oxidoreductase [Effusibacillus consociatus]|uniref:GMC oxidoreductase n=1 Tax=Effusibacillus consociatus TaxID=1117041 RepID=A0ABV9Q397_9BACL